MAHLTSSFTEPGFTTRVYDDGYWVTVAVPERWRSAYVDEAARLRQRGGRTAPSLADVIAWWQRMAPAETQPAQPKQQA